MSRSFFASILLLTTISGCRAEGACAIDSDCPLRFRCTANVCTALAPSLIDAGAPSADAGGVIDTGASLDAFTPSIDAPVVDAGPVPDANRDAGPGPDAFVPGDAFTDPCPTLESDYSVSSFSRGCLLVVATRVMFARTGPACSYTVTSDEDISGTVTLTGGVFTGPMSVGARSYPSCTVTPRTTGQLTVTCGTTCTVALLPLL